MTAVGIAAPALGDEEEEEEFMAALAFDFGLAAFVMVVDFLVTTMLDAGTLEPLIEASAGTRSVCMALGSFVNQLGVSPALNSLATCFEKAPWPLLATIASAELGRTESRAGMLLDPKSGLRLHQLCASTTYSFGGTVIAFVTVNSAHSVMNLNCMLFLQ